MTLPNAQRSKLPPQPQHPARLELEMQIAEAEGNQERWIKMVAVSKAIGRPYRREEEMLQLTTQKLHLLYKQRAILSVEAKISDRAKK